MIGKNKNENIRENNLSSIFFDEQDFLSGKDGVVWATYNLKQSEIIKNALLAQDIHAEINSIYVMEKDLFRIRITNKTDINHSIDFIWRNKTGLRLKPDWNYPAGEINKSFERWLSGNL